MSTRKPASLLYISWRLKYSLQVHIWMHLAVQFGPKRTNTVWQRLWSSQELFTKVAEMVAPELSDEFSLFLWLWEKAISSQHKALLTCNIVRKLARHPVVNRCKSTALDLFHFVRFARSFAVMWTLWTVLIRQGFRSIAFLLLFSVEMRHLCMSCHF